MEGGACETWNIARPVVVKYPVTVVLNHFKSQFLEVHLDSNEKSYALSIKL